MRYKKITSPSNPIIREAIAARDRKKAGRDCFLIEGRHLLEMALAAGADISRIFFTSAYELKSKEFLSEIAGKGIELIETTGHVFSKFSDTETPQGIAAVVDCPRFALDKLSPMALPMIVICDGIQDPGNLGAIVRTADAVGADAVIMLPGTCDPFIPKAIRSSAGSIFNLPIVFSNPESLIEWLKKKGVGFFVADAHGSKTIYESNMKNPLALAFGNEASGVGAMLKKKADMTVRIPIYGKAESLNVAISASICLYEAVRQRGSIH